MGNKMVEYFLATSFLIPVALAALSFLWLYVRFTQKFKGSYAKLPTVPAVPGLPVIGNLLQLKKKKPYKTFTKWAEKYGPIYSIRLGATSMVVLNSNLVAREALVTRHSSIYMRKLSTPLEVLTSNKSLIATSDYDDFYKMTKRFVVQYVLGPSAQNRHQGHRDTMRENLSNRLQAHISTSPHEAINFKKIFVSELFGLALKQALGKNMSEEGIYIDELRKRFSGEELFQILVTDVLEGAIEVDWRDFFPYLRWIPNKSLETKIQRICSRRKAVMQTLMDEQKKRIDSGENINCSLDCLLSEAKTLLSTLTMEQITMLVWETIITAVDTTLVTTEWAMYQLGKDPIRQQRLYEEIRHVCGSEKISEEHLRKLPYLNAVFHETLRYHSPVAILLPSYASEDTHLGGYFIPKGTEIAINTYGCNMDKNEWESPEEWKPERFMDEKYDPMDMHKTIAFGAGKRACAGSLQALLIACTGIGRLVQEFEWKLIPGEEADVDSTIFTTHKLRPLHVIIKSREN